MIKDATFEALYLEEIQDLYDAEEQIINALPRMISVVSSAELKGAFEEHLEQTKQHRLRLQRVLADMHDRPGRNICEGMRALLAEGALLISQYASSPVLDAALIGAAQQVRHYEICGYGTACKLAEMLGHEEALALLRRTLQEEKDTDADLSEIAETVIMGEELEDTELAEEEIAS